MINMFVVDKATNIKKIFAIVATEEGDLRGQ
jgi:hypothetical protein